MFRHQGKNRTLKHNIQIATILSFVAGLVNVAGFLSIQRLTTNVTGHFAYFMYDFSNLDFWKGSVYLLYIVSFLVGSFVAGILIEFITINKKLNVFVLPTILECVVLVFVALLAQYRQADSQDLIACLLLFAMGVQNSFVTKISNTVVRTTHLTGLFTDLGLELAQLLFPSVHRYSQNLKSTIKLRLFIIFFFFTGGVVGAYLYSLLHLNVLLIATLILLGGLIFDNLKFKMIVTTRKYGYKHLH